MNELNEMRTLQARAQATGTPPAVTRGTAQPHLLVIGPREADIALLSDALETLDIQMAWVADEEAAAPRLATGSYDMIVVVLPLGHDDGLALCRRLRAADAHRPLVLLQTAGPPRDGDVLAGFEAGADAYLIAPIHVGELRAHMVALLRRTRGVSSAASPHTAALEAPAGAPPAGAQTEPLHRPDPIPSIRAGRRTLAGGIVPWRRGLRMVAATALITTGVLGDRVLQANATSAGSVAAAGVATAASVASTTSPATSATTATSAALDAATERAFAIASPSVVYVVNVGVGSGSGVIYDSTGDIVTNAHVVSGATKVTVTLNSGKTYTARIVGADTADDLAVIHINASGLTAARFATAASYQVAETVLAIGSPLGLKQTVTSGLISALDRTVQESTSAYLPNALQTSAAINPGNSGGALVDLSGAVVGIPTLEATDPQNNNGGAAQGIGFAVPSSRVTAVAHQIIATGTVAHTGRAYLGVAATDAASAQQSQVQDPFSQGGGATTTVAGAVVTSASGPAAQAGVQQGDVITALNGTAITGQNDLLTALAQQKPGATVTLTLNRNGSVMRVHVTLGELAANAS